MALTLIKIENKTDFRHSLMSIITTTTKTTAKTTTITMTPTKKTMTFVRKWMLLRNVIIIELYRIFYTENHEEKTFFLSYMDSINKMFHL